MTVRIQTVSEVVRFFRTELCFVSASCHFLSDDGLLASYLLTASKRRR